MKQRLLLVLLSTVLAVSAWFVWVAACDHDKQASAQASACSKNAAATAVVASNHGACTADMAAKCTAAMAAKCAAKGANATAASAGCTAHGTAAMTASAAGCTAHGTAATTASASGCGAHTTKGASAGACKAHDASTVSFDCLGHGMLTTAEEGAHSDCDACSDMATCSHVLSQNGAQTQVLPLKNGVMFVYTTDTAARVRAVQSAIARRTEHLLALASSGDRAKLCPECRHVRGAIASGKLSRETVNIEGGCLTLMTSTDPAMVTRLRGLAVASTAARTKI